MHWPTMKIDFDLCQNPAAPILHSSMESSLNKQAVGGTSALRYVSLWEQIGRIMAIASQVRYSRLDCVVINQGLTIILLDPNQPRKPLNENIAAGILVCLDSKLTGNERGGAETRSTSSAMATCFRVAS